MKKLTILICMLTITFVSCGGDDDGSNTTFMERFTATAVDGTWAIQLYSDDNEVKTEEYNSYTFDFMSDGTVEAMNGVSTESGTWSITTTSGDDKLEALEFNMEFSGELAEFNRSWDVEDFHDDLIELIGDLELIDRDYLTFEKL